MHKRLEQITIEDKYSRGNIRQMIINDIEESEEILRPMYDKAIKAVGKYMAGNYYQSKMDRVMAVREAFKSCQDIRDLVTDILIVIMPVKGAQPIQGACGAVAKHLGVLTKFNAVRTAAELIAVICESDLYDIIAAGDSETGSMLIESNFELSDEVTEHIQRTKYLPPMVCKPNNITKNRDSARLTFSESMILGKVNHHDEPIALDVLNIANSVKFSIDRNMVQIEETSNKVLDTETKVKNFELMKESSSKVYGDIIESGNEFYITHKYDMRGRLYSQGYYLHIQGNSYKKSLMNLAKKVVITC